MKPQPQLPQAAARLSHTSLWAERPITCRGCRPCQGVTAGAKLGLQCASAARQAPSKFALCPQRPMAARVSRSFASLTPSSASLSRSSASLTRSSASLSRSSASLSCNAAEDPPIAPLLNQQRLLGGQGVFELVDSADAPRAGSPTSHGPLRIGRAPPGTEMGLGFGIWGLG